ncbi:MAG: 23S rRNA (uracil(1939)-C(5))-methyltransferase RlmD [Magnetococcales bacterium]|nr:23S rRNA (uracil(1939)-C(5))-methyltransferase RlmD [Magnetococcales bacterium]
METIALDIERVVAGGHGLAHHQGQAVFVPFAAPGDRLRVALSPGGRGYLKGEIREILAPGPWRVEPPCPLHGQCGGCRLLHLAPAGQGRVREEMVAEAVTRVGRLALEEGVLAPILPAPAPLGYRRRAGFKVRRVGERVLLGFFAAASHRVVDLPGCPVLHPRLAELLGPLRELIATLSVAARVPQVDGVCGDNGPALVFHLLREPGGSDRAAMAGFARDHGVLQIWAQMGRKGTLRPLVEGPDPCYRVGDVVLGYRPEMFTQANFEQNRPLAELVLEQAGRGERVVDLFCGVGNFTLPLAGRFRQVLGLEGYGPAVARGRQNAREAGLTGVTFQQADLLVGPDPRRLPWGREDVVVLDPPRQGAVALAERLAAAPPRRVVYVSCDPATFARDAARLVRGGLRLAAVVPVEMLPQTHHVELTALFLG